MDGKYKLLETGKGKLRRFGVKVVHGLRHTAEKSASVTTSAPSPTPAVHTVLEPPVTFADVAGIDEVRQELEEIVQFLRDPARYDRLGARIPRGALLVGPPGTGKTLLAKAVACEAGVPFFSMSSSEFVEMYVGVGASRVRDLFHKARQAAPCVIFLDELDAVGRKRSMRVAGNDERDQTLNQLLVELDGFNERQSVVVMAATNRVDILDKALLRPGRFDRHISVSLPDRAGRQAILEVHTRRTPLHEEVSLARLARLTTGMSGADLANLVNEAALCAVRQELEQVNHECFEDALARVQLGALRPLVMSENEKRILAFHEGGHALVAYHVPEADTVNRVTILARGQSLGVTQFTAEEDRYNYSRETLMARIAVGLGGRVAEERTFGPEGVTTGAENDLRVVTDLAYRMVTRWGKSEQVGVMYAESRNEASGVGLNMRRFESEDMPWKARALICDADGHLVIASDDQIARQHEFAMMVPEAKQASSATLAAVVNSEVQRILRVGPALNIYGILFGPPCITTPPRERYVVWNYPALSTGREGDKITLQQFTNISSETTIEGYSLYVPDGVDHIAIIARFTLTYHDVFNRKHASIYDFHAQYGWICRGHYPNIAYDIRELDRQAPMTQQAEQFWIAVGKLAQP